MTKIKVIQRGRSEDGCLPPDGLILMIDGRETSISDIVYNKMVGESVWGLDDKGNVIPSKILAVRRNGFGENWLTIEGTFEDKFFSLECTYNHPIFIHPNICFEAWMVGVGFNPICYNGTSFVRGKTRTIRELPKILRERFDITTETGNFFAKNRYSTGQILVHNSNLLSQDGRLFDNIVSF